MPEGLAEGTVTVLFTDVEGSTGLTTSRGDEAALNVLRSRRDLVRCQIEEHSGHDVTSLGDGFMVAFASARKAVACAVAIQHALDDRRRRHPDQQPRVRIGLDSGEGIREEEEDLGAARPGGNVCHVVDCCPEKDPSHPTPGRATAHWAGRHPIKRPPARCQKSRRTLREGP